MPIARARNGSASHNPAQDATRNSPTTLKSARGPASRAPTRSHIAPVAGPASVEAARQHPARARAVRGQVRRRSINSPGCRQISLAQRRQ
jgi:hypothetical protein